MNRVQRGIAASLGSALTGLPAVAQTTTSPSTAPVTGAPLNVAPGAGGAPAIMPGTTTGAMPPATTGGTIGTAESTLPGTNNTPVQHNPGNTNTASSPAVTTSDANKKTAAASVKGAKSFTMNEARRRIEAAGLPRSPG